MVFVNTKRAPNWLERTLDGERVRRAGSAGDVPQKQAPKMMRDFHNVDKSPC